MRSSRIALTSAILLTLAILTALIALSRPMYPLHPGNSADFWQTAARVDIGGASGVGGSIAKHGPQWVYTQAGYEGPIPYVVSHAAVMKDLPRAEEKLAALPLDADPDHFPARAYRRWKTLPPPLNTDVTALSECMDEAIVERVLAKPQEFHYPIATHLAEQRETARQIARTADFYPANFVFELLYLSFLVWFTLWPWLRGRGLARKLVHGGLLPLLFYLPLWFGYCVTCYYRGAAFNGILYPWLAWFSFPPLVSPAWELHFLSSIPPLMSALNQGMPLTYGDFAGFRTMLQFHGVTDVALRCFLLVLVVFTPEGLRALHRFINRPRDLARPVPR